MDQVADGSVGPSHPIFCFLMQACQLLRQAAAGGGWIKRRIRGLDGGRSLQRGGPDEAGGGKEQHTGREVARDARRGLFASKRGYRNVRCNASFPLYGKKHENHEAQMELSFIQLSQTAVCP